MPVVKPLPTVSGASTSGFALRVLVLRGSAAHMAYLAEPAAIATVIKDLSEELVAQDVEIALLSLYSGWQLVASLAVVTAECSIIDARPFGASDWALLDRRCSSLAHRGVLIFVTTSSSFDCLMRSAPHLASWLGAQVFAYTPDETDIETARIRRLEALRAWANQTDADVIRAAEAKTLPRDPPYAEWLVLLGRGDLLTAR